MSTFDGLWIIHKPADAKREAGIVYALGDTRESAWANAACVIGSNYGPKDAKATLSKQGYKAKRCTVLVEG